MARIDKKLQELGKEPHKEIVTKCDGQKEVFLVNLEAAIGNVTKAAHKTDLSRQTVYRWMEEDELFAAAVKDIQVNVVPDFLEDCLYKAAQSGNAATIIYGLNNKGAHRGWSNEQHISMKVIPQANIMLPSSDAQKMITIDGECEEIE